MPLRSLLGFATPSFADIQDPPSNDYGPTRKLGRGLSNLVFGIAELPATIAKVNAREGNSAAAGYGVVRGLGRSGMRIRAGSLRNLDLPVSASIAAPTIRCSGATFLTSKPATRNSRPELGNESKYPYVRKY